ncbi:MAG: DCC1-like thiol-disulfide oxidoreductase family protein, partial [Bacteroidota bacterium]
DPTTLDSIVLFTDDQVHLKSTAALKIGAKLGGLYKISSLLLFIPRVIRDGVYDFIARNRYRWFGRQEACLLPRPEWQSRFLG